MKIFSVAFSLFSDHWLAKNCRHFILSVMNWTMAYVRIRQKQMKRFKTSQFSPFLFPSFALPHRNQDTSTKRLGTLPILFICPPLAVSQLTHYGGRLLIKLKLGCGDNYSYSQISCCSEYITMQFGCGDDSLQIFFMTMMKLSIWQPYVN